MSASRSVYASSISCFSNCTLRELHEGHEHSASIEPYRVLRGRLLARREIACGVLHRRLLFLDSSLQLLHNVIVVAVVALARVLLSLQLVLQVSPKRLQQHGRLFELVRRRVVRLRPLLGLWSM
jgi:hypothetical protein